MPGQYTFTGRRLSAYETVLDFLRELGSGIHCHVVVLHSGVEITEEILRQAFTELIHYQPLLGVCVHTERGPHGITKRFVESVNKDDYQVQEVDSDSWQAIVEDEFSKPFLGPDCVLWKVLYTKLGHKTITDIQTGVTLRSYALIFKVSHVIADHISVHNMLTKQLVKLLRADEESFKTIFPNPLFMKPSVDECFMPSSSNTTPVLMKKKVEKSLKDEMKDVIAKRDSAAVPPDEISSSSSLSGTFGNTEDTDEGSESCTKLTSCVIASHITQSIVVLCEKHDVTVQEMLAVTAAQSYYIVSQTRQLAHVPLPVEICTWMDMRAYHGSPFQDAPLGMWMCPVITKHKYLKSADHLTPRDFWQQVTKLSSQLKPSKYPWKDSFKEYHGIVDSINKDKCEVSDLQVPKAHVALSFLDARGSLMYSPGGSGGEAATSIVHVTHDADSPLAVEEYHVTGDVTQQSVSVLGLHVVLSECSLYCTLSRQDKTVSKTFAEEFLTVFCKLTSSMARSEDAAVPRKMKPQSKAKQQNRTK